MTIVYRFPGTQSLCLLNATRSFTGDHFADIASRVSRIGFVYMLSKLNHLKELDLTGCSNINGYILEKIGELAPQVEVLKLGGCKVESKAFRNFLVASSQSGTSPLKQVVLPKKAFPAVQDAEIDWLSMIADKCPKLQDLDASQGYEDASETISETGLKNLGQRCSKLEVLTLPTRLSAVDGIGFMMNLKELNMRLITKAADFLAIASGCLNLTNWTFGFFKNGPEHDPVNVLLTPGLQLPSLKRLQLTINSCKFTDKHVAALAVACRELETFSLTLSYRDVDESTVSGEGFLFPKLLDLDVTLCRKFTGCGATLPSLQRLDVTACEELTASGLESLLSNTNKQLLLLNLSETQVTNEWLGIVAANCPELAVLNLNNISTFDADGMLPIVKSCSKLTKLNMKHVKNVKGGEWLDAVRDGALAHLQSLDLDGEAGKTEESVYNNVEGKVERKVVEFENFVTDEWVFSFAKGCPLLEEVSFLENQVMLL